MPDREELHVVFGTGPVGMAVMRALVTRGRRVRVVNRAGRAEAPDGVEVVDADAADAARAREICAGAAVVYNCTNAPNANWPLVFPPMQRGIIEASAAAGAKLVSAENTYMYGEVSVPMTEDLPHAARAQKGRTRGRMAEVLMEAHDQGRVRAAIGRCSDFYGPYAVESVVGERVFHPALEGKRARAFGDLDAPHTYTFVDDFGRGLVTLGERDEALGQVWHIPSAETLTTRQFIAMVFEEAGTEFRVSTVSGTRIRLLGRISSLMKELAEMLYEFEQPFVVSHSKYENAFGNESTPHREAIRRTLDWFREHPAEP